MKHLQPVSVEVARQIALPILLNGYRRRGQQRATWERAQRAEVKLERDDKRRQEPRVCAL